MLSRMGIDEPERLVSLRYRGNGWPGRATAVFRDDEGAEHLRELTYEQSWGQVLQRHRQWRCHVCADHTGEFADVAVGDPWYRSIKPGEAGDSLIVARTARGRRIVEQAIAAGYLVAKPVGVEILAASQPNLLKTRGAVWGRLLAMRLLGCLAPRYRNMPLFGHWRRLGSRDKLRSLLGTARRVRRRSLYKRVALTPIGEMPAPPDKGRAAATEAICSTAGCTAMSAG